MGASAVTAEERIAVLRLCRSTGIGPITFRQLITRFGNAQAAIDQLPAWMASKPQSRIALCPQAAAEEEFAALTGKGGTLVVPGDAHYPQGLMALPDAPPVLSVLGDPSFLTKPSVGIVGARNASVAGRRFAAALATDLGRAGYVVVSGLARGIDGVAHQGALETGTVAVLAGGVDQIYPPEHGKLHAAIAEKGAVVSEVRLGQIAKARDFPKRNRIVSGLSQGVVVVEAAARSGTLITARLALEQGREVFAVPGSPLDPRSEGTNRLIRQGAVLTRGVDDVVEVLAQQGGAIAEPGYPYDAAAPEEVSDEERGALQSRVLALLSYTPTHRDSLIRETGAPSQQVADTLLDLVLEGQAEEAGNGTFVLSAGGT